MNDEIFDKNTQVACTRFVASEKAVKIYLTSFAVNFYKLHNGYYRQTLGTQKDASIDNIADPI